MKVIAINGSPRKEWNTGTLLNKALDGARSKGADTSLVHLYDLDYKGCISCFECKTIGGQSYGRCAVQDGLTPVLKQIEETEALILGTPIYFGAATGEMRSFMERLLFPYLAYSDPPQVLFPGKIRTAAIYTMNAPEEMADIHSFDRTAMVLKRLFGSSESLFSFDTYQFDDYSKVVSSRFDPEKKAERRKEVFPIDCQRAFDLGARLAEP